MIGFDDKHDGGEDQPGRDVVQCGAGQRERAQAGSAQTLFFQDMRQHRKCGNTHRDTDEQRETSELYMRWTEMRIKPVRQQHTQCKR